nr:reverse transcriptase domain-containing protein [Tanacetum cinerariifolium]
MIIKAEIGGHCIHRMYVDGESASEILYEHYFNRLCPEIKNQLVPSTTPLIRFSDEIIWLIGKIQLLVRIEDEEHSASAWMNFMVVRSPSLYNGIIGRPGVRKLHIVPSTAHGILKLLVEGGVFTLKSSRLLLLECAMVFRPERCLSATKKIAEERVNVAINPEYLEQTVMIGSTLSEEGHNKLCDLLQRNLEIFAWKPTDMTDDWNPGATYQRMVDKSFDKQIGRNLEVYVDDLVNKSRTEDAIVKDIEETFKTLRKINMNLNLKKCTFGVEEGMFLGDTVNTKGLKVFSDKKSNFHWTAEAEEAFKPMKQLIAKLPMLTATMEKRRTYRLFGDSQRTVKGQILADFIVKRPEEDYLDTLMEVKEELPKPWILFTDRSSCIDGFGAGLILTNLEGMEFTYALRFRFDAINNEAEYEALIDGPRIVEQMGVKNLQANVDSWLVANQINGTYLVKEADMIRYLEKLRTLTSSFKAFSISQILRSENKKADALSKITSTSFTHLSKQVLVEEPKEKSINEVEVLAVVEEEGDTWMTPIFKYLTKETLPADVKEARELRRKSQ